jgi:hypothetical protein
MSKRGDDGNKAAATTSDTDVKVKEAGGDKQTLLR